MVRASFFNFSAKKIKKNLNYICKYKNSLYLCIRNKEQHNTNPLNLTHMETKKTEKQIWIEKETAKIMAQGLSKETTRRMLEMINDFANWSF